MPAPRLRSSALDTLKARRTAAVACVAGSSLARQSQDPSSSAPAAGSTHPEPAIQQAARLAGPAQASQLAGAVTPEDHSRAGAEDQPGPPDDQGASAPEFRTVSVPAWRCGPCGRECVPVRGESRCLCGHRLRQHADQLTNGGYRCTTPKCPCAAFYFVMAEGAWTLRCRCKHRATEHCAATHACARPGCACAAFHSPWVCNCDHAWAQHQQVVVERKVLSATAMLAAMRLQESQPGASNGSGAHHAALSPAPAAPQVVLLAGMQRALADQAHTAEQWGQVQRGLQ